MFLKVGSKLCNTGMSGIGYNIKIPSSIVITVKVKN